MTSKSQTDCSRQQAAVRQKLEESFTQCNLKAATSSIVSACLSATPSRHFRDYLGLPPPSPLHVPTHPSTLSLPLQRLSAIHAPLTAQLLFLGAQPNRPLPQLASFMAKIHLLHSLSSLSLSFPAYLSRGAFPSLPPSCGQRDGRTRTVLNFSEKPTAPNRNRRLHLRL